MNANPDKVTMRYEGDRSQHDKLECVFTYRGKDYRLPYYQMSIFAGLYSCRKRCAKKSCFGPRCSTIPTRRMGDETA